MMKDTSMLLRSSLISSALAIIFFIPTETYATEWNYREQSKIQWRDYGDAVFDEAKEKDKPLYVLIYADWCHWCKKFEVETLETEQIRSLFKERVIPVAVDNDMQPEIGQKIGSRLVPTSVILTPDGKQLLKF